LTTQKNSTGAAAAFRRASYQGAVSLDGFRQSIPGIVDRANAELRDIPNEVYDTVWRSVRDELRDACFLGICASAVVDETSIGKSYGRSARSEAERKIAPYIRANDALKAAAQDQEDGPALRSALKEALRQVIANRRFSLDLNYSREIAFPWPVGKKTIRLFKRTLSFTIINSSTVSKLEIAADRVDDIDPSYQFMFDAQDVVNDLPTAEIIGELRADVTSGVRVLPRFTGAGYTLAGSDLTSYVLLDDEPYAVDFNLLHPSVLLEGVGDLITSLLASE
jgi:hypothetical protein